MSRTVYFGVPVHHKGGGLSVKGRFPCIVNDDNTVEQDEIICLGFLLGMNPVYEPDGKDVFPLQSGNPEMIVMGTDGRFHAIPYDITRARVARRLGIGSKGKSDSGIGVKALMDENTTWVWSVVNDKRVRIDTPAPIAVFDAGVLLEINRQVKIFAAIQARAKEKNPARPNSPYTIDFTDVEIEPEFAALVRKTITKIYPEVTFVGME